MIATPHEQQIPPLRCAPVGMTIVSPLRSGRDDEPNIDRFRGGMLDALEGALDVFVGVGEGDGAAVGAGGGVFGFAEFG